MAWPEHLRRVWRTIRRRYGYSGVESEDPHRPQYAFVSDRSCISTIMTPMKPLDSFPKTLLPLLIREGWSFVVSLSCIVPDQAKVHCRSRSR